MSKMAHFGLISFVQTSLDLHQIACDKCCERFGFGAVALQRM